MLVNSDLLLMNSDMSSLSILSDLLLMNSDMSSLSILRAFCLNWHICLSINLYPRNYHNLANQSYSHTAHAHELLHNYYIEHHMKWEDE